MAEIDYSHSINIMKAAAPYFDIRTRRLVDFITKLMDFLNSYRAIRLPLNIGAYDSNNHKLDIEGLLTGIRPHCNDREKSFVDQILGIFNAKRMYETYSTYMNMMKMMQEFNNPDSSSENQSENSNTNFDFSSMFGGSGFGNFSFEDIQNMAKAFSFHNGEENSASENEDSDIYDLEDSNPKDDEDFSNFIADEEIYSNAASYDMPELNDTPEEMTAYEEDDHTDLPDYSDSVIQVDFSSKSGSKSKVSEKSNAPSDGADNSNVIDMLKTMLPPEQISTFENLSMLFKAMSYDNNEKPNQNKE
ncbi:MAG: hypothetical protein GX306_07415 [Clostridiales bacterium]|nr:hypothetical protein [Clostridiales bacterium]